MYNEPKNRIGKRRTQVAAYKYWLSHGQFPRGRGHWGFHPNFYVDALSPEIFWANGSFKEAKRRAIVHFTGKAPFIEVLS